jgi:hypothetical protein
MFYSVPSNPGSDMRSKIQSFIFLCLMEITDLCIPVLGFQIVRAFVIKLPASQHQEKSFPSVFSNLHNCNKSIQINTPNTNSVFKIFKGQAVQTTWPLKMGPLGCPWMSVTTNLRRITLQKSEDFNSSGSLKSRNTLFNCNYHLIQTAWLCHDDTLLHAVHKDWNHYET